MPPKKALTAADVATLASSDPQVITAALGSLLPTLATGRWLPPGRTQQAHLAASVPLHLADGWSYLARAVTAHLQGDYASSLHLAYYAELRAAVSLLANFGVAVGIDDHTVFESASRGRVSNMTTHIFVWNALQEWSKRPEAQELLERSILVEGVPLRDWLTAFNPGGSFKPTAQGWLRMWGLDLATFAEDRRARNRISYEPTGTDGVEVLGVEAAFGLVQGIWDMVEPAPTLFQRLDRELLRRALETQSLPFKSTTGWFSSHLSKAISDLIPDPIAAAQFSRFMLRVTAPTDALVIRAASVKSIRHDSVICRALLLLRVATAACGELLDAGAVRLSHIAYWWDPWGAERGFWPVNAPPADLLDMWSDVEEALTAIEDWLAAQATPSRMDFRGGWSPELQTLGGAERAMLWSIPA